MGKVCLEAIDLCKTYIVEGNSNNVLQNINLKIEEGERATPWSPAPEDVASSISEARSYAESILGAVQSQLDGKIDTWFFNTEPTTSNAPAVDWTTEEKAAHTDDLYYDTSSGYCYRWTGSAWERIKDSDITSAMAAASDAQDTADKKRRVFTAQPVPPYDIGDLWAEGAGGDMKVCKTAKAKGKAYAAADWVLASKYTDDSTANAASTAAQAAASAASAAAADTSAKRRDRALSLADVRGHRYSDGCARQAADLASCLRCVCCYGKRFWRGEFWDNRFDRYSDGFFGTGHDAAVRGSTITGGAIVVCFFVHIQEI